MTETPGLLLDITRTVSRAGLGVQTGVDRVERAWIRWALSDRWDHAAFIARIASGTCTIDKAGMVELLAALDGDAVPRLDMRGRVSLKKRPAARRVESLLRHLARPLKGQGIYANVGHSNLSAGSFIAAKAGGYTRAVVKLHDVIPLDHPEFARPDGPAKMRARLRAVADVDALIFNSADTAARALAHLPPLPYAVAPLGVDVPPVIAAPHGGFVCLGTIEPRKNHALLLRIWRGLAANPPPGGVPPLHIIGRRGWMNEAVFAALDSDPMMGIHVFEHADMDDAAALALLAGATALLFPSLAEGYGLPLAEALALGVPTLASDLPALREVGGDAARYLDPTDEAAWSDAIKAAHAGAPPPAALQGWRAPTWANHFVVVDELLNTL